MKNEIIMKDGKPHKIAQVIMLPTEKESRITSLRKNRIEFLLELHDFPMIRQKPLHSYHLYILSSEEIKEGDWYYNSSSKTIHQSNGIEIFDYRKDKQVNWKIIASTNSELKEENVLCNDIPLPRPSDDFLKDFVKAQGKGFDKVLVEYEKYCKDISCGKNSCYLTGKCENLSIKIKISPDNTVTIRSLQEEKTSWSREELIDRMKLAFDIGKNTSDDLFDRNNWIKQNL